MKVNEFIAPRDNTGNLVKTQNTIEIFKGRWEDNSECSHPMAYRKQHSFKDKHVYFLFFIGIVDNEEAGSHISLSFWENQQFLWLQKSHWFQKEENIRYVVNILFLICGLTIGILNMTKN